MKKIAIIGCGRSGTRYTSKVLNAFGVSVGHEKESDYGTVGWELTMKDLNEYYGIFHQVRDPIKVMASCHGIKSSSWTLISKTGVINKSDSKLVRCMKYWLHWNEAAQERAVFTYRVEDLEKELPRIFSYMGWGYSPSNFKKAKNIDTADHTGADAKGYPALSWAVLRDQDEAMAMEIALLAKSYGYFEEKTVSEIEDWNLK